MTFVYFQMGENSSSSYLQVWITKLHPMFREFLQFNWLYTPCVDIITFCNKCTVLFIINLSTDPLVYDKCFQAIPMFRSWLAPCLISPGTKQGWLSSRFPAVDIKQDTKITEIVKYTGTKLYPQTFYWTKIASKAIENSLLLYSNSMTLSRKNV